MNPGWPSGQANMFQGGGAHLNPQVFNNPNFDVNQFAQQQQQQNGSQNHTPTPQQQQFPGQTFNPGSVVPAKRPHDGMSGSPQQSQVSRSQTPNYGNAGFPNPQQFANAPTHFQHLQQPGSNNATPSPTMQNQQFRPPQQPRMNNASPSPFPQQQQSQSQGGGFGNQMSPGTPQNAGPVGGMSQPGQMGQFGQQFGANPGMMSGMPSNMAAQMRQLNGMQTNAQQQYQMKLLQHQQTLRNTGMIPPRSASGQPGQPNNFGGAVGGGQQQPGGQMPNGQAASMSQAQMQQLQIHNEKRKTFLKQVQVHLQQHGRPFNHAPMIGGKVLDLYALFTLVASASGSSNIERQGQWQQVANKLGFPQPVFPTAPEEIKEIYATSLASYERAFFQLKLQQKQDQARQHAQQMAGFGGQQQSPTKPMPASSGLNQYQQHLQQMQQSQQQPQGTPVQATASLPQNGMTTPQQLMGPGAGLHHRRSSSMLRKPDQTTPQPGPQPGAIASPLVTKQPRPPSVKQESSTAVMKSDEPQSTNYVPQVRSLEAVGGYDIATLAELGSAIERAIPNMPSVDEMGVIDTKCITLSLASGIHGEVRYALDALVILTYDTRVALNLEQCEDLLDFLVDCAEYQTEALSEDAAEVSDALDLPSYEDVLRGSKMEAESLQEISAMGTQAYDLDRAADKVIAITTILRNLSFYEFNHRLLTSPPAIKWLSNTIRLLGTRNMLLRNFHNTQDFYKDVVILLSNVSQNLELPSRDDALHMLHFLLAFAPQPPPSYTESSGVVRFTSYSPSLQRYLPPAVDSLAKLLARQDPNRMLYKSIFHASPSSASASESPLDLLTRAFGLAISVLPDRTKGNLGNNAQLRIVEARKAFLSQGMLAADIISTLLPSNDTGLAKAWIESEDGWVVGGLNLAALLSVDRGVGQGKVPGGRDVVADGADGCKLITQRCLGMIGRLAERAGKGNANGYEVGKTNGLAVQQPKWEGIPQGHAILGALMMPNTDKVALGLLCGLHEMVMQS